MNAEDLEPSALRLDECQGSVVVDVWYDGARFVEIASSKVETRNTHGTGCTLASAIAARLAAGDDVSVAVSTARRYLDAALRGSISLHLGRGGHGPFLHSSAAWVSLEHGV